MLRMMQQTSTGGSWEMEDTLKPEERHKKGKKEHRRNQDGAERRKERLLLMLVFGSRGAVFSVVLTSDLITGRRLPDQKPL